MILASGSPRRKDILAMTGMSFEIIVSNVDETSDTTNPAKLVEELAIKKAKAVYENCIKSKKQFSSIIGADTMVVIGEEILGKPRTVEENLQMLQKLNNRAHCVYSGVCIIKLIDGNPITLSFVEKTEVFFADNPQKTLKFVSDTKDGLDKAGGYGIQNYGGLLVKKINGCYYNIMGLPINRLLKML